MAGEDKIRELQHYFQSKNKHTYLKGGADRITSVAIPLAFVGVGGFLLFGGLANMYRGVGKRDQ